MLASVGAALDALSGEVAGLLSSPPAPAFAPQVTVKPIRAGLAGLGGFVGVQETPRAELHARRIDAEIVVRVRAADDPALLAAEAQAAREIVAADTAFLRRRGILRLERVMETSAPIVPQAPFARDLRFAVRFEHRPLPAVGEGVLGAVPQDVMLPGALTSGARLRYATEMLIDPLGDFESIDGGNAGTPGSWTYDPATQEIRQTGTRRGGADGLSANKAGSYLMLRSAAASGDASALLLQAELRSDGPGGIGLVFGFTGPQDFDFVLLEEPAVRVIGRRTRGAGAALAVGGQDPAHGFPTGQWLRLRLLVAGGQVELALDETVVLAGADSALGRVPGRVGFFCRNNGTARFRHFRLSSL